MNNFKSPEQIASRRIYFNIPLPSVAIDKYGVPIYQYTNNKIRTSKYTLLTFIPQNLYEQFHRVANIFFLFMVTMQAFKVFGVVNPVFAALPLVSIMIITAIKDGYEDLKRHSEDNIVNNTPSYILDNWTNTNYPKNNILFINKIKSKLLKLYCKISQRIPVQFLVNFPDFDSNNNYVANNHQRINESYIEPFNNPDEKIDKKNGWKETPWKDIRVGDIILLSANENVPADIVVLSTSEDENECYVETKKPRWGNNIKEKKW